MAVEKDINEALMNDILTIYSDAEDKMLKAVAKRVAKGIQEEGWNEKKLAQTQALKKEIEKVLADTSKLSNAKISKGVIDAYKQGIASAGGPAGVHNTILDELDLPMNLKMLILATNGLLDNASLQVLRKADDAFQQIQAQATTGLLAGTDTRRQASQKMLNQFAAKGITSFVDKAGRNWDLSSYAEMAARTVGSHAALQGHIDRQVEVGEDLVKVSKIGTTCPICQRWQGVVLSISGNHPKYHSLESAKAAGLFHPNCKHTLMMYIPELDDGTSREGKVEPDKYDETTQSSKQYFEIQKQRANERKIRYWKKRLAVALDSNEAKFCQDKIKEWQYKNLLHCEKHGLRRNYAREGVMTGYSQGPMGSMIGGNLKEYEQLYKDVIGQAPKPLFMKLNLQYFAEKKYEQWLKEEIQSLDELDIDKAMMKDANNKNVTPTSLYKKYIGDNPMQDYTLVSPYEKGTKEYKSGYAKWLKDQINEIGVSYKIKPKYVEVHESVSEEDKALSATNIYKKYYGEAPTEAYKKLGGEEGTGMKYGKWVETQKKELIKNGITKTVPFGNTATQKTVDTITQAKQTIDNAKETLKEDAINKYKEKLEKKVHGAYDGYLQVSEQLEIMNDALKGGNVDEILLESDKLEIAMKKHLEMVKKKAEKTYGSSSFDYDLQKLKDMVLTEADPTMKEHIKAQIDQYQQVKNEKVAKDEKQEKLKLANEFLKEIKADSLSYTYSNIKSKISDNFNDPDIYKIYGEAYKVKQKQKYIDFDVEKDDLKDYIEDFKEKIQLDKDNGDSLSEYIDQMKLDATKEFLAEQEAAEKKAAKKKAAEEAKAFSFQAGSGKVTLGRSTRFDEGQLVERDKIYQKLSNDDLDKLAQQVPGHALFSESRRDILGRDKNGRNHHMGHDVRLKSGLTDEQKELGKAFQTAYNDYFNTIKCQDINLAYLKGYSKASKQMKEKIDDIRTAIHSVELNEPVVLHRFVTPEIMEAVFKTKDLSTLQMGSVYDNDTFMSAAVGGHPTFGKRNHKLTIQVDKGTHALPTLNYEEGEFLLDKGKLEVVRVNKYDYSNPQKLQNFDGSYTEFTGDEVVVRYVEDGKAKDYEMVTVNKIDEMLTNKTNVTKHTKESKDWIGSLSSDEMTANKRYTGSWYVEMNNVYRRGQRSDKQVVKYSEDLTSSLRRAETKQPVVLRRGVNESDLAFMLGFNGDTSKMWANVDDINKGGYAAEDKGFLSTSPIPDGGFSKAVELRIFTPAGTHAAYVDSISSHKGEKETILNSGSMYKVLKIEKKGYNSIVWLELLGTD